LAIFFSQNRPTGVGLLPKGKFHSRVLDLIPNSKGELMDIFALSNLAEIYLIVVLSVGLWYLRQLAKRVARVEHELQALQKEQMEG